MSSNIPPGLIFIFIPLIRFLFFFPLKNGYIRLVVVAQMWWGMHGCGGECTDVVVECVDLVGEWRKQPSTV